VQRVRYRHGIVAVSSDASPARDINGSGSHVTLDRKLFYQHVTSRDAAPTASRPQTLTSSSTVTPSSAAAVASGSWSAFSGRTFPRRGGGTVAVGGPLQAGRRRIADQQQVVGRLGRTTPPNDPRSHSRSYSDLHSEDRLTPPLPPPPLLDLAEPRGSGPTSGRARTSSTAAAGVPRGGSRRGDSCSWTLDRHRSTAAPACTNSDVTPRECVVDCRQTGHPVYDV